MRIEARVSARTHDFVVVVGDDAYEMNADAHLPNGVCIYLGAASDLNLGHKPLAREVPVGVLRKVVELALRGKRPR